MSRVIGGEKMHGFDVVIIPHGKDTPQAGFVPVVFDTVAREWIDLGGPFSSEENAIAFCDDFLSDPLAYPRRVLFYAQQRVRALNAVNSSKPGSPLAMERES